RGIFHQVDISDNGGRALQFNLIADNHGIGFRNNLQYKYWAPQCDAQTLTLANCIIRITLMLTHHGAITQCKVTRSDTVIKIRHLMAEERAIIIVRYKAYFVAFRLGCKFMLTHFFSHLSDFCFAEVSQWEASSC